MRISRHYPPQAWPGQDKACYLAFDSTFSGRIASAAYLDGQGEAVLLAEADYRDSADLARLLRWLTVATIERDVFVLDPLETRYCLETSAAVAGVPAPLLRLESFPLPLPSSPWPGPSQPFPVRRVSLMRALASAPARRLCQN